MPFQISLTGGSRQLGQINSFDAGVEQFATCATAPAAGEVNIIGEYGDLIFNAADVGKTVTGSYLYVTKRWIYLT